MNFRFLTAALACAALAACAQTQPAPPAPTPTLFSVPHLAPAGAPNIKVQVDALKSGHQISTKYGFCMADGKGNATAAPDRSPRIAWSKGPVGTKSYAVMLYDTDSPAEHREWMNQQGQTLTAAVKRKVFIHMVVVDVPSNVLQLVEGAESDARVVHGKQAPAKIGVHGANSFTQATAANDALKGTYYGYDGPCPPWNDTNAHHYHFAVYALSVTSLGLHGDFGGEAALAAMQGKVLAQGELIGLYSTTPAVMSKLPK
jgi:Raf kinase inhibitor-like YbhB/YbcL family protein